MSDKPRFIRGTTCIAHPSVCEMLETPPRKIKARRSMPEPATEAVPIPLQESAEVIGCSPERFITAARSAGVPFDEGDPQFTMDEIRKVAIPLLKAGGCAPLWAMLSPEK